MSRAYNRLPWHVYSWPTNLFHEINQPGEKRKISKYLFQGKSICRDTFCFINAIGESR